jgi:Domain of unknown function DUF29
MTSRIKDNVGLVPPATDYGNDFYGWLIEQAGHVRDGRWDAVDRENLAEEIESSAREQFNKLESALRVLMLHMLKWDHQPEKRTRSWALTVRTQRLDVEDVLSDNPSLRPHIPEAMARGYRKARVEAAKETGLDENVFPVSCPYDWNDVMGREL